MAATYADAVHYVDHVPERKRLLTSTELARAIGLSVRTIQRYRSEGWITPALVSLGGHARWDEDSVREQMRQILENQREQRERADRDDAE